MAAIDLVGDCRSMALTEGSESNARLLGRKERDPSARCARSGQTPSRGSPRSSLRKERLLGMTIKLHDYPLRLRPGAERPKKFSTAGAPFLAQKALTAKNIGGYDKLTVTKISY